MNYNDKKIMVGLSAGINSAAVLVWLASLPAEQRPRELHLYYAHFEEHSPDSLQFVLDCVAYAKTKFEQVIYTQTNNSVIEFFEKTKMIPHPATSSCSRLLKIEPMMRYMAENKLDLDLIGYVREEKQRATKMRTRYAEDSKLKEFPILQESNEWCFEIVKQEIGWYPAIYDLRWNDVKFVEFVNENLHRFDERTQRRILKKLGTDERVFKHNNCLPCKNMYIEEMLFIEFFYSSYLFNALALSERLKKYWGRNADEFYTISTTLRASKTGLSFLFEQITSGAMPDFLLTQFKANWNISSHVIQNFLFILVISLFPCVECVVVRGNVRLIIIVPLGVLSCDTL